MAYFLKKTQLKKGLYLQIYFSYHDKEKKTSANKAYKTLGYVSDLMASGIEDPIAYYQNEVDKLNQAWRQQIRETKIKKVSEESPLRNLGYFLPKAAYSKLNVDTYIDFLHYYRKFDFKLSDLLRSLVLARIICPCSKSKTFHEVFPLMFDRMDISVNQMYEGIELLGAEYERVIEIFNHSISEMTNRDTSTVYFDCTNFYFEIDYEDELRRKGPSKENRNDPIVGLGLLLDKNQIPLGMKIFPGNESEKPVLRDMIDSMKKRNHIIGKTVQVGDKGVNCTQNIIEAVRNGDGYIFSQSVKKLPDTEKTWILLDNDYRCIYDENKEVTFKIKSFTDRFPYRIEIDGAVKTVNLKQKRVVVWNGDLARKQRAEIMKMRDKIVNLSLSKAKRNQYKDYARYIDFEAIDRNGAINDDDVVIPVLNEKKIQEDLAMAGYNLLISSETYMTDEEIYDVYHNLWRIEESFRIMKSQLEARPVFLSKQDSIKGHFLICYISILIFRLLQFLFLKNSFSANELATFIRGFKCALNKPDAINLMPSSPLLSKFENTLKLGLDNYYLSENQIQKLLNFKF